MTSNDKQRVLDTKFIAIGFGVALVIAFVLLFSSCHDGTAPMPQDTSEIRAAVIAPIRVARPEFVMSEQPLLPAKVTKCAASAALRSRVRLTTSRGTLGPSRAHLFDSGILMWSFAPQLVAPHLARRSPSSYTRSSGVGLERSGSQSAWDRSLLAIAATVVAMLAVPAAAQALTLGGAQPASGVGVQVFLP